MSLVILSEAALAGVTLKVAQHTADGDDRDWIGTPTYLGGVSTYSQGEFIHTDFLLDDYGANVDTVEGSDGDPPQPVTGVYPNPQNPAHPYAGSTANNPYTRFRTSGDYGYPARSATEPLFFDNVADIAELRVAASTDQIHFLIRLAALKKPDSTIIGIGIDADRNIATGAGAWPRGANMPQQLGYDYFVTLWGSGGEVIDYTGATPVALPITVAANTDKNFIEASMPRPRGMSGAVWRLRVGAGLNNGGNWQMVQPTTTRSNAPGALGQYPNIFNLLFRPYEPTSLYRDRKQANDLARRDITEDYADLDLAKLDSGTSDAPLHLIGLQNPQYDTIALGDGEGIDGIVASVGSINFIYKSATQPFMLYLPTDYYANPHANRMMLWYHCLNCNHNVWPAGVEGTAAGTNNTYGNPPLGTAHTQSLIDNFDLVMAGAMQGGESRISSGSGGTLNYGGWPEEEKLLRDIETSLGQRFGISWDVDRKIYAGMSMGGGTTRTMCALYPDELMAAYVQSAAGAPDIVENIRNVYYIFINGDTGLDGTAAVDGRAAADDLTARGYEHFYMEYLSRAHDFSLVDESWPITTGLLRQRKRDPNPAHVTYTMQAVHEVPALGLVHDHAYWATGLKLADGAVAGTLDAYALPLASKLPAKASRLAGTFTNTQTLNNVYVSWLEYQDMSGRSLLQYQSGWTPLNVTVTDVPVTLPEGAGANGFSITLSGLAASALDMQRMGIDTTKSVQGKITTAVAHRLALVGDWPAGSAATLDGAAVPITQSGRELAVDIPSGAHMLNVGGNKNLTTAVGSAQSSSRYGGAMPLLALLLMGLGYVQRCGRDRHAFKVPPA